MRRILFSLLTLAAIVCSATKNELSAQNKLVLTAEGISFDEYNNKNFELSSIIYANKNSVSIGGLAPSVIPAVELGWNVLSNIDYALYKELGMGNFMDLNEWKSTQVTINLFGFGAYSNNRKIGISAALGIRANNYRLDNNTTLVKTNGMVMPSAITDIYGDIARKKSKFTTAAVHIPIEVQFGNPKQFAFSVGGYIDMMMNSHTKIKFVGGSKEKLHNFPTNFIQAGATMRLTFHHFSIYASYQPTQLFKTDCGPKMQQWSIGLGF